MLGKRMKTLFGILCAALLAPTMRGEEYREFPRIERPWVVTPLKNLPTGVSPSDPSDPQRAIESVLVWHVDIDADGHADMVIEGIGGGTGGPYVCIYRKEKAGFREVLSTQGWLSPLGVVDGSPRLELWGRSGGREYSVTRLRWERDAFVEEYTDWLMENEECRLRITHRTFPKPRTSATQDQPPKW